MRILRAPPQHEARARPRDGAPAAVLGTVSLNPSNRCSAGHRCRAAGRGPAARSRLDAGQGRKQALTMGGPALAIAKGKGLRGACPLRPPGPLQHPEPVFMGDLGNQRLAIAVGAHGLQKGLLADHIANPLGQGGAVEI